MLNNLLGFGSSRKQRAYNLMLAEKLSNSDIVTKASPLQAALDAVERNGRKRDGR